MFISALGIATKNQKGEYLEVFYPWISNSQQDFEKLNAPYKKKENTIIPLTKESFQKCAEAVHLSLSVKNNLSAKKELVLVFLLNDKKIETVPEAYLKLHLLSQRLFQPNSLNLENLFSILPNVVWTNTGAVELEKLEELQFQYLQKDQLLSVKSLDKFPPLLDYIIPSKVRIADAARVRLGAYLGEGTTVMHEGFVNFNAGTEGPNMIEGRISAGVFVAKGSDLGGGCSIMGTLSGGGTEVISVGEDCLIGANAGIGISLGDRCTVEAGLYITAGAKVKVIDNRQEELAQVKALQLSKKSDLLFRRNSLTGGIECLTNENKVKLNQILHKN